jgi:hypothetical protein
MKRYVIFGLGGVAALFVGAWVTGKRADTAGNMLVRPNSTGLPLPSNYALMAAGAGVLLAYLTK